MVCEEADRVVSCALQAHGSFVHIVLIGVRPESQNQGIGTRLLRRVLGYADEHSLPAYVEASAASGRTPLSHALCSHIAQTLLTLRRQCKMMKVTLDADMRLLWGTGQH